MPSRALVSPVLVSPFAQADLGIPERHGHHKSLTVRKDCLDRSPVTNSGGARNFQNRAPIPRDIPSVRFSITGPINFMR
jgi:hypothetical protein